MDHKRYRGTCKLCNHVGEFNAMNKFQAGRIYSTHHHYEEHPEVISEMMELITLVVNKHITHDEFEESMGKLFEIEEIGEADE